MSEPLILIPGMMCDARVFSDQILALNTERAVHLAPLCLDSAVPAMARRVLDTAPARFALAGHGLGGVVAMELFRMAPDRVSRLALMSCTPLAETPQEAAAREPRIVRAQSGRLSEALREEFPADSFAPTASRQMIQAILDEMAGSLGAETYLRQSRAMQRRPDQQGVLRRLKAPTLVLCGIHDKIAPPRRHEFMAELIRDARLEVIDEAGHMPMIEAPDAVTQALARWLAAPYRLG